MNDPANPYAAPKPNRNDPFNETATDPFSIQPTGEPFPAERGTRFLNYIIDYIVQFGLSFALGFGIVVLGGDAGVDFIEQVPGFVLGILILFAYYFVLELSTGRTLGKLITGTKVVAIDGGKPTAAQIAGRTLSRIIPFEAFSFLGTPCVGWHDSLSGTRVVKTR